MPKHYEPLHEDCGPRRVGESIEQLRPGSTALSMLQSAWVDVVGASLAARTRPQKLAGGTLVIVVEEPAVATALRYEEATLLARCAEAVGTGVVNATRTVVRPLSSP